MRRKIAALSTVRGRGVPRADAELRRRFGIGVEDARELTACGNFESLFRMLRQFLYELVCPREQWLRAFLEHGALAGLRAAALQSRYWPVAFQLFFADALLAAMFGPDAVQHAPKGSYPAYFQRLFERGLARADAFDNPWLHHVLLGHYVDREAALPDYLVHAVPDLDLDLHCGSVQDRLDWEAFDLVSLSNVFDWMSREAMARTAAQLAQAMRPGAVLLVRQLNHQHELDPWLEAAFALDHASADAWLARDRSLFYSRLTIATRRRR
ncbi:MAG: class I SAM-dependent methyltransferase [Planctomycetota bacterium]